MALIGNHYRQGASPTRNILGSTTSVGAHDRQHAYVPGLVRSGYVSQAKGTIAQSQSYPAGNGFDTAWFLAPKAGGMSWRPVGVGVVAAGGLSGRLMLVDLTGEGDLAALAALIVAMASAMSGSGSLTVDIAGRIGMDVALSGDGDMAATATGLAALVCEMLGGGDLDATITAFGDMSIDITVQGAGLTTTNVGAAVWAYLIEAGYDAAQVFRLVMAAAGGEVTGAPGGPIEVLGLDGVTVRLTGEVDTDGNRTMVVVDAD